MAAPPCDQCTGTLNPRYPLRLVAAGGPDTAPTQQRWVCTACIGLTLDTFTVSGRDCAACADLAEIFERLVTAVRTAPEAVLAIHVPPAKAPHRAGCDHAA